MTVLQALMEQVDSVHRYFEQHMVREEPIVGSRAAWYGAWQPDMQLIFAHIEMRKTRASDPAPGGSGG